MKEPVMAGIYFIQIQGTDKFYIGESRDIIHRFKYGHLRSLLKNKHSNKPLQHAYNKYSTIYGKDCVTFTIYRSGIENGPLRIRYEKYLIYKFRAIELGFNLKEGHYGPIPKKCKSFCLTNVFTSEVVLGKNVAQFARERGMNPSNVFLVVQGKKNICCGWYRPEIFTPKIYELVSPSGEIAKFFNIKKFAEDNSLSYTGVKCLLYGKSQISNGWTRSDSIVWRPAKKIAVKLKSPAGETIIAESMTKFAIKNDITVGMIRDLLTGKKLEFKGWQAISTIHKQVEVEVIAPPKYYSHEFYFKNLYSGEEIKGKNITKFCRDRCLMKGPFIDIGRKKRVITRSGWYCPDFYSTETVKNRLMPR